MRVAALAISCALGLAASARADVIEAPPTDCPAGAAGSSSHEGTRCAPTACTDDASCEGWANGRDPSSLVCRPQGLCIARSTVPVGGRVPLELLGTTVTVETALSACESDAECPADLRCEVAPRCVELSMPAALARRAGCACHAGAAASGSLASLVTLGLALVLGLRRAGASFSAARSRAERARRSPALRGRGAPRAP